MGTRVPCPPGAEGCSEGSAGLGEPASVCRGLGHTSCAGGTPTLNPFGEALRAADFQWTTALCQADSDGDGQTNGQELGDPCCLWFTGAPDSAYMAGFSPSHPGDAASNQGAGYGSPECDAGVAPAWPVDQMAAFNHGEEQRRVDFIIKNYTIPSERTTYVDFVFNFRDTDHSVYHIVFGEALVDQPRHLHHYVVTGCDRHVADYLEGVPNPAIGGIDCNIPVGGFSGWAPGAVLWDIPVHAGVPIGEGVGIVGFRVNVHFTDGDLYPGGVSQDGLRVHYTPDLRNDTIDTTTPIFIPRNPSMVIPPGLNRWFVTRTCEVLDVCEDVADELAMEMTGGQTCSTISSSFGPAACNVEYIQRYCPVTCGITSKCLAIQKGGALPLVSVNFHGHLLGSEMYQTLTREGVTYNLGSAFPWHYDDQVTNSLLSMNLSVQAGDVLQSTCVYQSDSRSEGTSFGKETVDEMCIIALGTLRSSTTDPPLMAFGCRGDAWTGQLSPGEDGLQVALGHPASEATLVWRPGPYGSVVSNPSPLRWEPEQETTAPAGGPGAEDAEDLTSGAGRACAATPALLAGLVAGAAVC